MNIFFTIITLVTFSISAFLYNVGYKTVAICVFFGSLVISSFWLCLFLQQKVSQDLKLEEPTSSHENGSQSAKQTASESNQEAAERKANGIRSRMCDIISGEFKLLIKKQVDPWVFYNSKGVHLKSFDDEKISMSGVKYNDQAKAVFFSHIEPYIEDTIKRMIEDTCQLAKDRNVPISKVLGSSEANLSGGINTVYKKIQIIDRNLRGGGNPESVPKRDVSNEIKRMNDFLNEQIKTAKDLHFEIHKTGESGKDHGAN